MRNLRTEQEIMANWKGDLSKPVVSVCCIAYNHELYIEDALEGFLIQETNFPFEIIIHDDASTDKTTKIICEYLAIYPNIIKPILQTENQYSKGGLSFIIEMYKKSRGSFIAICEGDDYWVDPNKIQMQSDILKTSKDIVLTYTDCQSFDENGFINKDFGGARKDLTSLELERAYSIFTLTACFKNVFKNNNWPKELNSSAYGDLALWSFLGEFGSGKFLGDIKPSMYRVHDGGVHSKKDRNQQMLMRLKTFVAILDYKLKTNNKVTSYLIVELLFVLLKIGGLKVMPKVFLRLVKLSK